MLPVLDLDLIVRQGTKKLQYGLKRAIRRAKRYYRKKSSVTSLQQMKPGKFNFQHWTTNTSTTISSKVLQVPVSSSVSLIKTSIPELTIHAKVVIYVPKTNFSKKMHSSWANSHQYSHILNGKL